MLVVTHTVCTAYTYPTNFPATSKYMCNIFRLKNLMRYMIKYMHIYCGRARFTILCKGSTKRKLFISIFQPAPGLSMMSCFLVCLLIKCDNRSVITCGNIMKRYFFFISVSLWRNLMCNVFSCTINYYIRLVIYTLYVYGL